MPQSRTRSWGVFVRLDAGLGNLTVFCVLCFLLSVQAAIRVQHAGQSGIALHKSQLEKIWEKIHDCQRPAEPLERILHNGLNADIEAKDLEVTKEPKHVKQKKENLNIKLSGLNVLMVSVFMVSDGFSFHGFHAAMPW